MVDALTVFGIAMPFFLGMMGGRLGIYRGIFLELQQKCKVREDEIYLKFEALLFAIKDKEPDPEQILNHAAQYLSSTKIGDDLTDLYTSNKKEIGLDILGIALAIAYLIFGYHHIRESYLSLAHSLILAGVGVISLVNFVNAYYQINNVEKKLEVGVMKHRFDFLNRIRD